MESHGSFDKSDIITLGIPLSASEETGLDGKVGTSRWLREVMVV